MHTPSQPAWRRHPGHPPGVGRYRLSGIRPYRQGRNPVPHCRRTAAMGRTPPVRPRRAPLPVGG